MTFTLAERIPVVKNVSQIKLASFPKLKDSKNLCLQCSTNMYTKHVNYFVPIINDNFITINM